MIDPRSVWGWGVFLKEGRRHGRTDEEIADAWTRVTPDDQRGSLNALCAKFFTGGHDVGSLSTETLASLVRACVDEMERRRLGKSIDF